MKGKGIFCQTTAATNEEYRKELKRKNWIMALIGVLGLAASVIAAVAWKSESAGLPDYMVGVYCGMGTGITLGCLILIGRNLLLFRDEEKLKRSRLENSDERLRQISGLAIRAAVLVMMIAALAAGLIGGIFYPILIKAFLFILYVFLFSYLIACRVYDKRM
jgi:hypothetical protein